MSPYLAEFLGTMLLVTMGNGVVAGVSLKGTKSNNAGYLVVVLGWGLAVALAIYAVGRTSAHLNPAVTLALFVNGDFPGDRVIGYMLSQFAGAFAGAILVWIHYMPHWKNTDSPTDKLGVFSTGPAIRSLGANFVSEMIGTMILVMGLLFIGANSFADGLNPLVIGGLIVSIGISLGGTTGFGINPARDLGPRLAHFVLPIPGKGTSDWAYSWVPVLGPFAGGLLGSWLYNILFM
jgi:glycerol uptake facilitator protein